MFKPTRRVDKSLVVEISPLYTPVICRNKNIGGEIGSRGTWILSPSPLETLESGNSTRKIKELCESRRRLWPDPVPRNPEMNSSDQDRDYVAVSRVYIYIYTGRCWLGCRYDRYDEEEVRGRNQQVKLASRKKRYGGQGENIKLAGPDRGLPSQLGWIA